MTKAILLATAQTNKRSVFQFEKKHNTLNAIISILHDLGFATWDTNRLLGPIGGADTGKPTHKYTNTLYDDKYYALQRGQYQVEIFFGKKKVILAILTMTDERQALTEHIRKYTQPKQQPESL